MTLASEIACRSEIDLKWLNVLLIGRVVVVGNCRSSHFEIITAEEKEERVANEANDV